MLEERKAAILQAVVEEYIATAQPVGSSHLVRSAGLSVSAATVRNEMGALEQEGYLTQPHTSAGRVPTEKGYRFFVDRVGVNRRLDPGRASQVREFFARAHGELEALLADTSRLLSEVTAQAAVVVGPAPAAATIRAVQLVGLAPRLVLLVIVLSNGAVDKHALELDEDTGEDRVGAASAHLAAHLTGRTLGDEVLLPATGDPSVDALCGLAVRVLDPQAHHDPDAVFVGGVSRMAAGFGAVATLERVLAVLEQHFLVVTLLRDVLDRGLTVAIGTEHGVADLADCSVVVAPYVVDGEPAGTVGVLGPTRMDYAQALAAVSSVSARLGKRLSEGTP